MEVLENHSLLPYNSFGIDVKARYFIEINDLDSLQEIIHSPKFKNTSKIVIGGGSNILFTKNVDGLVLRTTIKGIEQSSIKNDFIIKSMAGEVWHDLVLYCLDLGLAGIENLSLIPGLAGAAPIQNIGAYGVEFSDIFESLEAVDLHTGELTRFTKADCQFSYRRSIFKEELQGKLFVLSINLALKKHAKTNAKYGDILQTLEQMGVDEATPKAVSEAVCKIRTSKLPDPEKFGNAGSFFMNPELEICRFHALQKEYADIPNYAGSSGMIKVSAGWMIEQCGWKGKRLGNAGVYKHHALTLLNHGGATGKEIVALAQEIKESVQKKFNVTLEEEVNLL